MIILGIDPGSRFCGYGLLQVENNRIIGAGCEVVKLTEFTDLLKRLDKLYTTLSTLMDEHMPDVVAVESMFMHKHVRSVFTLGHARGVILLAIAQKNLPLFEYSPREVKKAVVGNGNATKEQVRFMISKMLNLRNAPATNDAYDALGIALCHHHRMRFVK